VKNMKNFLNKKISWWAAILISIILSFLIILLEILLI